MLGEELINVVAGLLFCIAVTLFSYLISSLSGMSELVSNQLQRDSSLAEETYLVELECPPISYAQVCSELMNEINKYDLVINGVLISKENYNLEFAKVFLPANDPSYIRQVIYDEFGSIDKVIYDIIR